MPTNMFAKFHTIDGGCEDKNHEGWCEISSVEQDFDQKKSVSEDSTTNPNTSKVEHSEITISKIVDEASMELMKYCWEGRQMPTVEIRCFRAGKGKVPGSTTEAPILYFKIELKKVVIKKFAYKGDEGNLISEDLDLVAGEAKYTFTKMDKHDGSAKGFKQASHNLLTGVIA